MVSRAAEIFRRASSAVRLPAKSFGRGTGATGVPEGSGARAGIRVTGEPQCEQLSSAPVSTLAHDGHDSSELTCAQHAFCRERVQSIELKLAAYPAISSQD